MNLQEILSHRSNCLICGEEMNFHAPDYPNLTFHVNKSGMKIQSGHTKHGIQMFFGFDGKYTKTKQDYKIYREPISIIRSCGNCHGHQNNQSLEFSSVPKRLLKMKSRSTNLSFQGSPIINLSTGQYFTSLDNLKSKGCAYRFQLMGDAEGNYDGSLNYEIIRYYNEKSFWHVDTSYVGDSSILHYGDFSGHVEDILSLRIDSTVNLNSVQNTDQLISKLKMYMLMS